jgi:hypothetical protein
MAPVPEANDLLTAALCSRGMQSALKAVRNGKVLPPCRSLFALAYWIGINMSPYACSMVLFLMRSTLLMIDGLITSLGLWTSRDAAGPWPIIPKRRGSKRAIIGLARHAGFAACCGYRGLGAVRAKPCEKRAFFSQVFSPNKLRLTSVVANRPSSRA